MPKVKIRNSIYLYLPRSPSRLHPDLDKGYLEGNSIDYTGRIEGSHKEGNSCRNSLSNRVDEKRHKGNRTAREKIQQDTWDIYS